MCITRDTHNELSRYNSVGNAVAVGGHFHFAVSRVDTVAGAAPVNLADCAQRANGAYTGGVRGLNDKRAMLARSNVPCSDASRPTPSSPKFASIASLSARASTAQCNASAAWRCNWSDRPPARATGLTSTSTKRFLKRTISARGFVGAVSTRPFLHADTARTGRSTVRLYAYSGTHFLYLHTGMYP